MTGSLPDPSLPGVTHTAARNAATFGNDPTPRELAGYVLNVFGAQRPFPQAGSFYTSLVETVFRADLGNRARLGIVFPVLVSMVDAGKNDRDGVDRLAETTRTNTWEG